MSEKQEKKMKEGKSHRRFRIALPKLSNLHVQREPFPFILRRSVVISIVILVLGGGLSLISTATTYVSQLAAGIIK